MHRFRAGRDHVSILTLAAAGSHIVSSSAIYGGSLNLFAVTLKRLALK